MSSSSPSTRATYGRRLVLVVALLVQLACAPMATVPMARILVPDLTGTDSQDAATRLEALGFFVETKVFGPAEVALRFGADRAGWPTPGGVIEQRPAGGRLEPGAPIRLWVADYDPAAQTFSVPSITGLTLEQAQRALAQETFDLGTEAAGVEELRARFGNNVGNWPAPGSVIAQRPAAESLVRDPTTYITALMAEWSLADLALNNLLGARAVDATGQFEAAGFSVQQQPEAPVNEPDARRGDVLSIQLTRDQQGNNVVRLGVANANGRNVPVTADGSATRDADGDGVIDRADQCPNTADGAAVDVSGCVVIAPPPDADADGVPDAVDACPDSPAGVSVNASGCGITTTGNTNDRDNDGVLDADDFCPDTPPGNPNPPNGCSLTQQLNLLPIGQYAFNRQTSMQVGRPESYKVVLVLDPRESATPTDVQARVLSALPATDRPPDSEITITNTDECAPPVTCFRAKYATKMKVDLRVDQDGWTIRPDNPVEVRGVVDDDVTQWAWNVTPACDGGGLIGECRPATLTMDAYAVLANANFGPIMVFNEQIVVEVAADERVASFFERNKELIFGALIFPVLIALATWWLSRRRVAAPTAVEDHEAVSVLFVGANPRGTSRIRLDEEVRAIDQSIRLGARRDAFTLHQHWAARVSDLDDALMRYQPNIVHISAHGTQNGELLLEGGAGDDGKVSAEQLEKIFGILSDDIRLVVLNACFSEEQAQRVVNHVDCVVGMSDAVNDKDAQKFSESFYLALANGRSVQTAFELACAESIGQDEQAVPRLLAMRADPDRVMFARQAPARWSQE